jgi:hypothetical protein
LQTQPGPVNQWPFAVYKKADGTKVSLGQGIVSGESNTYSFPAGISPDAWAEITLTWEGINIASVQNAKSSLAVQRNRSLLDSMPTIETATAFQFSSATIEAPNIIHPLNQYSGNIYIDTQGNDVSSAINQTLGALFDNQQNDRIITMGILYGYQLNHNVEALTTYLPVGLYPHQSVSDTTGADINDAITTWKNANSPSDINAEWSFSLILYSDLTNEVTPLVELKNLVYKKRASETGEH